MSEHQNQPEKRADLATSLPFLVNGRYGNSQAEVLHWALVNHRDKLFSELLTALRDQDYENAYTWYRDYFETNGLLTELILSLAGRADANYWATRSDEPAPNDQSGFNLFMRQVVGIDPAGVPAESETRSGNTSASQ